MSTKDNKLGASKRKNNRTSTQQQMPSSLSAPNPPEKTQLEQQEAINSRIDHAIADQLIEFLEMNPKNPLAGQIADGIKTFFRTGMKTSFSFNSLLGSFTPPSSAAAPLSFLDEISNGGTRSQTKVTKQELSDSINEALKPQVPAAPEGEADRQARLSNPLSAAPSDFKADFERGLKNVIEGKAGMKATTPPPQQDAEEIDPKVLGAFLKNLVTQEFTGPFGPDWEIRRIPFEQGYRHYERCNQPAPSVRITAEDVKNAFEHAINVGLICRPEKDDEIWLSFGFIAERINKGKE